MFTVERPRLGQLKTSRVPVVEGVCFPSKRVVHAYVPLAEGSTVASRCCCSPQEVRERVSTIMCERRSRQK
jgi:hypothetical protein